MQIRKVLLINPPTKAFLGTFRVPAGLGYISEILCSEGIQCTVVDTGLGYSSRQVKKKIREFEPDLIGISLYTLGYKYTYSFISELKTEFPSITIVAGGPHISTVREKALLECGGIDFGVVLEGEYTLLELCSGKDVSEIAGLIRRDDGKVVYNGDRAFAELDKIAFPRYEEFELQKYIKEIPIISSRGCPYHCIYCPVGTVLGRRFRIRSASNVVDEIQHWYRKGYRQFNILDDNFTLVVERVYEICDEIEKRGLRNLFLQCSNGVRADRVDRELLKRMRDVGFRSLAFGVESGNDRILKAMKKEESIETIESAIRNACELGYDVALFFIVGTPGETIQEVWDSVHIAQKYPIMKVNFYNITPYPATELFAWLKEREYFLEEPEVYLNHAEAFSNEPVFVTPQFPLKDKRKIFIVLKKVEREVMKRWAFRKFRPYVGVFAYLLSLIFVTSFAQRLLFGNRLFRRALENARFWLYARQSKG